MELTIIHGNAFEQLKKLPDNSIDLCITSPPYWGLRSYGTEPVLIGGLLDCEHSFNEFNRISENKGKCEKCGAWRGEYGNEPTMEEYLDHTLMWVREIYRILKPTGSFVLNIGDCFIGGGRGSEFNSNIRERALQPPNGVLKSGKIEKLGGIYKTKQFMSVSSFLYCRIISETNFVCRGEHIWAKPNVPSPIRTRLKHSHEKMFWFVKDADKYYFDKTPWMKEVSPASNRRSAYPINIECFNTMGQDKDTRKMAKYPEYTIEHSWRIIPVGEKQEGFELTKRQKSIHIAPFPSKLIRPYIASLCPPEGVVLDPFLGSGTTMRVAMEETRSAIGIELNEEYIDYAKQRLNWRAGLGVVYKDYNEGKHADSCI